MFHVNPDWLGSTGNSGAPRVSPARAIGSTQSQGRSPTASDHLVAHPIARPYGLRSYTHACPAQAHHQGCPSTRAPADRDDAASRAAKSRPVPPRAWRPRVCRPTRMSAHAHPPQSRSAIIFHWTEPTTLVNHLSLRPGRMYLRLTRLKETSRSRRCRPPRLRAHRPAGSSGRQAEPGCRYSQPLPRRLGR